MTPTQRGQIAQLRGHWASNGGDQRGQSVFHGAGSARGEIACRSLREPLRSPALKGYPQLTAAWRATPLRRSRSVQHPLCYTTYLTRPLRMLALPRCPPCPTQSPQSADIREAARRRSPPSPRRGAAERLPCSLLAAFAHHLVSGSSMDSTRRSSAHCSS
jgi:hypothetical protein